MDEEVTLSFPWPIERQLHREAYSAAVRSTFAWGLYFLSDPSMLSLLRWIDLGQNLREKREGGEGCQGAAVPGRGQCYCLSSC